MFDTTLAPDVEAPTAALALLLGDLEFSQLFGDVFPVGTDVHFLVDVEDLAIFPNVKRPALGKGAALIYHAVGSRDALFRIA